MKVRKFKLRRSLLKKATKYSISQRADLSEINTIHFKWYMTKAGVDSLKPLRSLVKSIGITKNNKGSAIETVMKAMPALSPYEQAWLEVAKAMGRKNIWDFGVELTPKKGLLFVEGGKILISELKNANWIPREIKITKKVSEQRKAEGKEKLAKLIFWLTFERNNKPITIPKEFEVLTKGITWQYCHVWFNPIVFRSITINFTKALFGKIWLPPQWLIVL